MVTHSNSRSFLLACELHDIDAMSAALDSLDVHEAIDGKSLVTWLVEMYTRSDRFTACLRLLVDWGAVLGDMAAMAVLLNDVAAIQHAASSDPSWLHHKTTLSSAFTPLAGASLLHVAAEFGHVDAAQALIALGADVNARADVDEDGLGGHTPLFHTVNSHANRSLPVMRLLLAAGADPEVRIHGLTWGRGFEWETTLFDLTPVSYAQCGLLPQMHRAERDIADNVRVLLEVAGRPVPSLPNVPNRYLTDKAASR